MEDKIWGIILNDGTDYNIFFKNVNCWLDDRLRINLGQ